MREIKFRAWDVSDKYEVSNDGLVFSNDYNHTGKRRELRQYLDDDGYPYVFLTIDSKRYKRMVHRLVAELFLIQPSSEYEVNHKNGIRSDSRLENLEWVTHKENIIHGWECNGRKHSEKQLVMTSERMSGEKNIKAKLTKSQVEELRELRKDGATLKDLSKMFGVCVSQVSAIALGRSWKWSA